MFRFGLVELRMFWKLLSDDDREFGATELATLETSSREMFALAIANVAHTAAGPPTSTGSVVVRDEVELVGRFGTNLETEFVPV